MIFMISMISLLHSENQPKIIRIIAIIYFESNDTTECKQSLLYNENMWIMASDTSDFHYLSNFYDFYDIYFIIITRPRVIVIFHF